jgi:hypothetical protein
MDRLRLYEVGFRDLGIAERAIWCRDRSGKRVLRWKLCGMPRLTPEMENCTFFMCDEKGDPGGTGFIVARDAPAGFHYYAITNKHVYAKRPNLRVNTVSGKPRVIPLDPDLDWQITPNGPDVAAADITDLVRETDKLSAWGEGSFATTEGMREVNVGIGDEAVMVGMFYDQHGNDEGNAPVGRFGSMAHLADERFKIRLHKDYRRDAYHLIDMRSRSGFSGSPVFLYRTSVTDLTAFDHTNKSYTLDMNDPCFLMLLGIHCGQFGDRIELTKARKKPATTEAYGDPIKEGDDLEIPSSMTCVLPAAHITDVINHPRLEERRAKRDEATLGEPRRAPRPEVRD